MSATRSLADRIRPGEFNPLKGATTPRQLLTGAGIMTVTSLGQVYGLTRYIRRLPGDHIGIGLYIVTAGWLALMAAVLLRKWWTTRRPSAP